MRALDWLAAYPWLPLSLEKAGPGKRCERPSKGELRRWCRAGSVLINGSKVQEHDEIPNYELIGIWQLVFFPDSRTHCTTMVQETIYIDTVPSGEQHDG